MPVLWDVEVVREDGVELKHPKKAEAVILDPTEDGEGLGIWDTDHLECGQVMENYQIIVHAEGLRILGYERVIGSSKGQDVFMKQEWRARPWRT